MPTQYFSNKVLASLSSEAQLTVALELVRVRLATGQILCESDYTISDVYFLESGVASVMSTETPSAGGVEVGLIGQEGFVSPTAALGPKAKKVDQPPSSDPHRMLVGCGILSR